MRLNYSDTRMHHWNPGATMPLILPIHMVCNTPDGVIGDHIRENSRNIRNWIQEVPAHTKPAILCGSGPSLADNILSIRSKAPYARVFAMNGAAKFLADRGIMPDYQVILDAQLETAQLIGPAKEHLFASQVHPELFKQMPTARLWHLATEGIDDFLPDDSGILTLIGGSSSVGNCATCLAYAMGYRNLQIYGYDSSHRGDKSHAFHQTMNDGDPCCIVEFDGVEYTSSLTMKSQAERFQETSRELIQMGCKIEVHGDGLLPAIFRKPRKPLTEEEKYNLMWTHDAYRNESPGLGVVPVFLERLKPEGLVIDFGCGTGLAALEIAKTNPVMLLDITDNCRNEEARHLPFLKCDFRRPIPIEQAPYGYCTDLLEHIPTEEVDLVLNNIMDRAATVFFQISTLPDKFGVLIEQYLHLTVRPMKWWKQKFADLGFHVDWEVEASGVVMFIISKGEN